MKFAEILLSETPEEEEDVDISALFGGTPSPTYWPGVPAYYGPESRSVLIGGEICETVANTVISQMMQLQAESPYDPIKVYVNTVGGDAGSAFALYDWMRCLTTPVIGIAYGRCSSAGLPILMGADFRLCTPRTRFFYHEVIGGMGVSSMAESEEAIKNYKWHQATMKDILFERCKRIGKRTWSKHFDGKTSFYFGPEFALEMGIVHDLIEEMRKKVKITKE